MLLKLAGVVIVLTFVFTKIYSLTIPTAFAAYAPPFAAVNYIASHPLKGNLFNDPEAGDVIIWNMASPPKVFIDTKFAVCPAKIAYDYLAISQCADNWQQLLKGYDVKYVFLPISAALCQQLMHDKHWYSLYRDEQNLIFCKKY